MRLSQLNSITFLLLLLLFSSCDQNNKKRELEKRETEIANKEKELHIREQQLSMREQALAVRERTIDSLNNHSDTLGIFNPALVGYWKVTMVCTETTCEGSAIGDTKTEHWNISYQNNRVIAKVIASNKLIRTYSGLYKENTLELAVQQASDSETNMRVILNPHPSISNLMEGQRVINQGGKCKIIYALKAEKL